MKSLTTIDWDSVYEQLNQRGFAKLDVILNKSECEELIGTYEQDNLFRKTINMARYRFGAGEYKYYQYPLPDLIANLRSSLYDQLVPLANRWMACLGINIQYPKLHSDFIKRCHESEQNRPTPLILKYTSGDYNTLHQDLYGEVYFPIQAIAFLNQPGVDYSGGELVLTEQIPRAQSKATAIRPEMGDIFLITTQFRPEKGSRGYYRKQMRHGVSEVTHGLRHTVGIIFHDAQ